MRFTLDIELGNEAMSTRGDVARVLVRLGELIDEVNGDEPFSPQHPGLDFAIRDTNGNTVGHWRIVEEPEDDPDDTYGEQRERFGPWDDDEEDDEPLLEQVYGVERSYPCVHGHLDCATVGGGDCANETYARLKK